MNHNPEQIQAQEMVWRVMTAVIVLTVTIVMLLIMWLTLDALLLIFMGILTAMLIHGFSNTLAERSMLSRRWEVLITLLIIIALLVLFGMAIAPRVAEQIDMIGDSLPASEAQFRNLLDDYQWGRDLLAQVPNLTDLAGSFFSQSRGNLFTQLPTFISSGISALTSIVVVIFVGLTIAIEPDYYMENLIRLVPKGNRPRAQEIFPMLEDALKNWMLARAMSMIITGGLVGIVYLIIGMPFALTLGLITAILTLIPYAGAFFAVLPALLLALTIGPNFPLVVLVAYLGVQVVEDMVLTPYLERRVFNVPAAVVVGAQVIMGILVGPIGIALAAPLALVLMVLVRMLYIEDVLGDREIEVDGGEHIA